MVRFRLSKYRAQRTEYKGRVYHSKAEADHARQLDLMKQAPIEARVDRWEPQIRVPLKVNGALVCHLVLDFLVYYSDGRKEYHEVKGVETPAWRLKYKLFQALYPGAKVRMIR
jgi:hypothetical protein